MKFIVSVLILLFFINNIYASTYTKKPQINSFNNKHAEESEISFLLKKQLKSNQLKSYLSKAYTQTYYKNNKYKLFWSKNGEIKKISYDLINSIKNDSVLKPFANKIFDLKEIEPFFYPKTFLDTNSLIKLDILLTGIYHHYMRYLANGFLDWRKFKNKLERLNKNKEVIANWKRYTVRKNIRKLLYKAVKKDNIYIAIDEVNYTFPQAKLLEKKLKEFEKLALQGGFIKVPSIKGVEKGDSYPQLFYLRKRLMQSKDLENQTCENINISDNHFNKNEIDCFVLDKKLLDAIKSFQSRNGLRVDGIIGKKTIKKLNESVEEKIKKIRINLERMRWMPRTLGKTHILINIPDFKLRVFNKDKVTLEMPVIVGEAKHPTPIFSNKMSEVVLNPYWKIPQGIVKKEIIPKLVKDSTYLAKEKINVYEDWDHTSMQYDVSAVDWNMYLDNDLLGTSEEAPMRFIQTPGKTNPLGKIKFLFPNPYSVYMHDTPLKGLFKYDVRAFSHGCIRLSEPNKLLETIASKDKKLNLNKANKILKAKERTDIELDKTIPVHIVYFTSWVDKDGRLHQRDDIYNYDKMQEDILFSPTL